MDLCEFVGLFLLIYFLLNWKKTRAWLCDFAMFRKSFLETPERNC